MIPLHSARAMVLAISSGIVWAGLGSARPAHAETAGPAVLRSVAVNERVGERVPLDLAFTDSSGMAVRLGDYVAGQQPVLLVMAYSRCPMLCNMVLRGVADVMRRMNSTPGRDYQVLTVSIDPAETPHDAARTQEVLLEQSGQAEQRERWPFLVGKEPAIRALADSLGFGYAWDERTEQFAHPAVIFVLTPTGVISRYIHGARFEPAELEAALRAAGAGLASPAEDEGGILSCFRFEAALRQYGGIIQVLFRGGALLIFTALVMGLVFFFRRERSKP